MPRPASPDLTLPLAQPITLAGGPRSHLVTLMDAAILIRDLEPFRQARPVWNRAAECSRARPKRRLTCKKRPGKYSWRAGTRIGRTIFPPGDRRNGCWVARTKPQSA